MNKILKISLIFAMCCSCATKKNSVNNTKTPSVYIEIDKNKTSKNSYGEILLYFNLINKSEKDITILKPRTTFNRIDFFSNKMDCTDIPISVAGLMAYTHVKKEDYLVVKTHSKVSLLMNGKFYEWLSCNSDSVKIKIEYEPFKEINQKSKYFKEQKEIMETVSNINIYSDDVFINLKK